MVGMAITWLGRDTSLSLFFAHPSELFLVRFFLVSLFSSEQGGRPEKGEMAVGTALLSLVPPSEHCCRDGHLQVASQTFQFTRGHNF